MRNARLGGVYALLGKDESVAMDSLLSLEDP